MVVALDAFQRLRRLREKFVVWLHNQQIWNYSIKVLEGTGRGWLWGRGWLCQGNQGWGVAGLF
jgi:hypothetical protein